LQSPARALKVEAGKENPNLTDNWDDAEGYYSKIHKLQFLANSKEVLFKALNCLTLFYGERFANNHDGTNDYLVH